MSPKNHKMQLSPRVVNFFGDSDNQIVHKSQGGIAALGFPKGETSK